MKTHLGHPDDPRRSACGGAWWRGLRRVGPRRVEAHPTCFRCPDARGKLDAARAARLARFAGRPLLVLDFDGVFNHRAFYLARGEARKAGTFSAGAAADAKRPAGPKLRFTYADHATPTTPEGEPRAPLFDRVCVDRAGQLARRVDAAVAVSSSWREGDSLFGLRALLVAYGFAPEVPFIASTPIFAAGGDFARPAEIAALVDELHAAPAGLVILDDDPIAGELAPFHVRTDPDAGGLTDELVERAAAMFHNPPAPIPWRAKEAPC